MAEPRQDMLPDESETQDQTTSSDVTPVSEDVKTQTQEPVAPLPEEEVVQPSVEAPSVGSKTPDKRLYAALQQEREKRQELEQKLKILESSSVPSQPEDPYLSDEARYLKQEINTVRAELLQITEAQQKRELYTQYPVLEDKKVEFENYRLENPELRLDRAAKLFLLENNLLQGAEIERQGLEKPTAGDKTPPKKGISAEEFDRLRETQPRKFIQMLRSGQINPDEIY